MTIEIQLKKTCSRCGQEKFKTEFYARKDRPLGVQSHCKECEKKRNEPRKVELASYCKKYYENNKELVKKRAAEAGQIKLDKIYEIKANTPCKDCGQKFHYCQMDFDHRDETQKLFDVSDARWHRWEDIEIEMTKCDIVCANCHRLRTFSRGQYKQAAKKRWEK